MDETRELKENKSENGSKKEDSLDTVKEKIDTNSWGYAVGFGTILTFVSIVLFSLLSFFIRQYIHIFHNK